jgi:germacradienol/geosmin synthase
MAQPFEMPEFYMPYPARINPNLEGAREHSKGWAREIGIVGEQSGESSDEVWDEHEFDSNDFALFTAYTHPDSHSEILYLLTEWYAWMWFVDDHLPQNFNRDRDMGDAKEYLSRLVTFMPLIPASIPPEPADNVERGLADLWSRTMPGPSADWRLRYFEIIKKVLEGFLLEITYISEERVPNPIDYIDTRRASGGVLWTATLVEYAEAVEIPPDIYDSRPIRVLTETFADWLHLSNDIISYQKDVDNEGVTNNGVHVCQEFLDLDLQQAVDVVNDLTTSRLHQFENTKNTELPVLFEEQGLGMMARTSILRYVKGLQDSLAGHLKWSQETARYNKAKSDPAPTTSWYSGPTGLGTSAARITGSLGPDRARFVPHRNKGRGNANSFEMPEFYMPFPVPSIPDVDAERRRTKTWARQMGIIDLPGNPTNAGVWDEDTFDAMDPALCAALVQPDAGGLPTDLVTDSYSCSIYMDDYVEIYKHRRDMLGAKVFAERLKKFTPADPSLMPVPINPVERSMADLWLRAQPFLSDEMRLQEARYLSDFVDTLIWEVANVVQDRLPDPVDCYEMRRETIGLITARIIPGSEDIPGEIHQDRTMQLLVNTYSDWLGFFNDIYSYPKELVYENVVNNSVHVYQRFLDIDLQQAVDIVNNLATARMRQLEYVIAAELPVMFDELELDTEIQEKILTYVDRLQKWLTGFFKYHLASGRFQVNAPPGTTMPERHLCGPTGLGTSATRMPMILR